MHAKTFTVLVLDACETCALHTASTFNSVSHGAIMCCVACHSLCTFQRVRAYSRQTTHLGWLWLQTSFWLASGSDHRCKCSSLCPAQPKPSLSKPIKQGKAKPSQASTRQAEPDKPSQARRDTITWQMNRVDSSSTVLALYFPYVSHQIQHLQQDLPSLWRQWGSHIEDLQPGQLAKLTLFACCASETATHAVTHTHTHIACTHTHTHTHNTSYTLWD